MFRDGGKEERKQTERWYPVLAGALVVAAFLLRIYRIGAAELWIDEAFSFYVATTNADLLHSLLTENNPPLYYLLLRLWVGIAGISEAALRLPSAISGTLFVVTIMWAGSTFFCRRVGLWAGTFAAVAPIHIYYSQEARSYALVILLLLLTYILLWRAMERNTWQSWAAVSLVSALAVYGHYFAVFGLVPTAVLIWCRRDVRVSHKTWRRYITAMVAGGLILLPWVVWSFAFSHHAPAGWEWITMVWVNTPPVLAIPKSMEILGLGGQAGMYPSFPKGFWNAMLPHWVRACALTALMVLAISVVMPWGDARLGMSGVVRRKLWLGAALLLPLITMWLISWFFKPIYLVGRYDVLVFPAYVLLIGFGLAKLPTVCSRGWLVTISVSALLFLPMGVKLDQYYRGISMTDDVANTSRLTAKELFDRVESGDVVVFTGGRALPVFYYLERLGVTWTEGRCEERDAGRRFGCRLYPLENEDHPGVNDHGRVTASRSAVVDDVQHLLTGLHTPENRVWIVFDRLILYKAVNEGSPIFPDFESQDADLIEVLRMSGFRLKPAATVGALVIEGSR